MQVNMGARGSWVWNGSLGMEGVGTSASYSCERNPDGSLIPIVYRLMALMLNFYLQVFYESGCIPFFFFSCGIVCSVVTLLFFWAHGLSTNIYFLSLQGNSYTFFVYNSHLLGLNCVIFIFTLDYNSLLMHMYIYIFIHTHITWVLSLHFWITALLLIFYIPFLQTTSFPYIYFNILW